MPDLLLELFSEEIPARMQQQASADLRRLVTDALVERGFTYADANVIPILHYLARLPESGAMIAASGALTAFMAKHAERPSVAATVPT